jgi:MFS family permease
VLGGGGVSGFSAAWFALLNEASPAGRRGRTFGLVSALSNLGIVLGAMSATAAWQAYGLGLGLLVPSLAVIVAGLTLLALPGTRRAEPPLLIKETVAASAP